MSQSHSAEEDPSSSDGETSNKVTPIKVAIAQIQGIDSDRSGNLVRIENAIAEASRQSVDLVCFPETAIYGWVNPAAHQLAHPVPGQDQEAISELARKYKVFVSIGLAEKEGDRLYDAALLIDDLGQVLLKHRKINTLDHLMERPYTKGDQIQTVSTRLGKVGILICADSFDGKILDDMKQQKPELMLIPYGWAAKATDWPDHGLSLKNTVVNAARVIGCPVVGPNLVGSISNGPWTGMIYGGQSYAADQQGNILAKGKDRDRDLIVFEVTTTQR